MSGTRKNKTFASALATFLVLCTLAALLGGATVAALGGNESISPLADEADPASPRGTEVSIGGFDVTVTQDRANILTVSGTAPTGIYGDRALIILNGRKYTLDIGGTGSVEPQSYYLTPTDFIGEGSAVGVRFGYTSDGVYTETGVVTVDVIIYERSTRAVAAPVGTTYLSADGTYKPLTGSTLPNDAYLNASGNAFLDVSGNGVRVRVVDLGNAQEEAPDPLGVGGTLYDLGGGRAVLTAVSGVEYACVKDGDASAATYVRAKNGKVTFTDLENGTSYTLIARTPATEGDPSDPVTVTTFATLSDLTDKDAFDALYASLESKLYASGELTATADETNALFAAYSKLGDDTMSLPAVREKARDVVISKYLNDHAEVIDKNEYLPEDKEAIADALDDLSELPEDIASELSTTGDALLDAYREVVSDEIGKSDDEPSDAVKAVIDEYGERIKNAETTTEADALAEEAAAAVLAVRKEELKDLLDTEYARVTSEDGYPDYSEEAKAKISAALADGKAAVDGAATYEAAKTAKENALGALAAAETEAKSEAGESENNVDRDRADAKNRIDAVLDGSESAAVKAIADAAKAEIDEKTDKTEMDAIVTKALSDIAEAKAAEAAEAEAAEAEAKALEAAKKAACEALTANANAKKASGLYNAARQTELDSALGAAIDAVNAAPDTTAVAAAESAGERSLDTVNVSVVKTGTSSGYKATVTNDESGFGSKVTLGVVDAAKEATIPANASDNCVAVTGTFDKNAILNALSDKKVLLTIDITLSSDGNALTGEGSGIYTVSIELPEELRNVSGLQVVSVGADGKVGIYDTVIENGNLVFTTTHFSEYVVIGDKSVDLLWVAVLFGALIACEAVAGAVLGVKTKKKKEEINLMSVMPFIAVVFTPSGIIPALVVLGVCVIAGGVAVGVLGAAYKNAGKQEEVSLDDISDASADGPETSDEAPNAENGSDTTEADVAEADTDETDTAEEDTDTDETAPVEDSPSSVDEAYDDEVSGDEVANETSEVSKVTEPAEEKQNENSGERYEEKEDIYETEEAESENGRTPDIIGVVAGTADVSEDDTAVDEVEDESDESDEENDADGNVVILAEDAEEDDPEDKKVFTGASGKRIYVSYDHSFTAKLALASDEVRQRYYTLSQLLLSYKVNCRRSWKKERYYLKGNTYVYMLFRGRTLCLCMSIAPASLEGTKYFFEDVSGIKKYESTPVMTRIRSGRACKYACELISMMFEAAGIEQKTEPADDYQPSEPADKKELIDLGLIKVLMTDDNGGEVVAADFEAMKNENFDIVSGGMPVLRKVTAEAVAEIPDEEAAPFVESENDDDDVVTYGRRKGIVNVDTISAAYKDGETVTLAGLKAKRLVPKNVQLVKVLARGTLDKSLTVKAHDFSMDAVKMIIIAGGKVVKLRSKRN